MRCLLSHTKHSYSVKWENSKANAQWFAWCHSPRIYGKIMRSFQVPEFRVSLLKGRSTRWFLHLTQTCCKFKKILLSKCTLYPLRQMQRTLLSYLPLSFKENKKTSEIYQRLNLFQQLLKVGRKRKIKQQQHSWFSCFQWGLWREKKPNRE